MGGKKNPAPPLPMGVAVAERMGWMDQISARPLLSQELALRVEEEGEEKVVVEERSCKQLGGYCSWV